MEDQCTCADCAKMRGYISRVEGDIERVFTLTQMTAASEKLGLWIGDECEQEHNHLTSKSCEVKFQVDGDVYDTLEEAKEAATQYECNFCGWVHTPGFWTQAVDSAAACCVTSCSQCGVTGWPNFIDEHNCRVRTEAQRGGIMRNTAPWVERGIQIDATSEFTPWGEVWGYDPHEVNIVQAAADYYLLEAISAGMVGTTDGNGNMVLEKLDYAGNGVSVKHHTSFKIIMGEASELLDALTNRIAPVLIAYTHMACGGELRHHSAVGGKVLSGNRSTAWSGWKLVFEAVGTDALTDAADLFEEFGGGAFGGKPWADACRILHAHLTGKINARMFLDRIFNHQHNGGVFLNKVQWAGDLAKNSFSVAEQLNAMPLSDMQSVVLPAHGATPEPDYPTLLAYASPEVVSLFTDSYKFAAVAAHASGIPTYTRRAKPERGLTRTAKTKAQYAIQKAKQAAENALYQPKFLKTQIKAYESYVVQYAKFAEEEAKKNAKIMADLASGKIKGCNCGIAECYYGTGISEEYQKIHKQYEAQLQEYKDQLPEAEAKAAEVLASGYDPNANPGTCTACGSVWHDAGSCLSLDYLDDEPCGDCGYYSCECF